MPRARTIAAAAVAGLGAAAAWYLAVKRAGERDDTSGPVRSHSRTSRNIAVAKLGSRAGTQYALYRARRTFADAGRRRELDERFELQTAENVADALGNMKGAL